MMLTLKRIAKIRHFLCSPLLNNTLLSTNFSFSSTSATPLFVPPSPQSVPGLVSLGSKDVASSFKEWFKGRDDYLAHQIYEILSNSDEDLISSRSADLKLSQLGIRLSQEFVIRVLENGNDVLSCLKFFDWAGRQPGFRHSRATLRAIFKILSKAKRMSLMLDFLEDCKRQKDAHSVRYCDTLVMGYAVAGKPDLALHLFGKMRFNGMDLNSFAYHVLVNALLEEGCLDAVNIILQQIRVRGFENKVTDTIVVKSLCKQQAFDAAEGYIRNLMNRGNDLNAHTVAILLDSLCKKRSFDKASKLVEEFLESGMAKMEHAYHVWIKDLVQAGKLEEALKFFQRKKSLEGYLPDIVCYNTLLCGLLREQWLEKACDLLMEMKEYHISPDKVTRNAALCFFCKAGMLDVALELYDSRTEFALSLNGMAYNSLINTLCGDGSTEEAYHVLKNSIDQGCFPGQKTFTIIADALCREGKLDKMKELLLIALECNVVLNENMYYKFISALCRAKRVEDGYLLFRELDKLSKITKMSTYCRLIHGFIKRNRGDIAARLLIEMQERGHLGTRRLFRAVIRCQCEMENAEAQFFKLLEMQLSQHRPSRRIYNLFIDGAGHAGKPDFAKKVYEMMLASEIEPSVVSDVLVLYSFLKNERVTDALNFFDGLHQRRQPIKKLYNMMVVGLCKAKRAGVALYLFNEMRGIGLVPTTECYEELIGLLCSIGNYEMAVSLINDLEEIGRHITSFVGNTLLVHASRSEDLYRAWVHLREGKDMKSPNGSLLGKLIGAFCGHIEMTDSIEDLEEVIGQCFQVDIFTYNVLLRRLSINRIDLACTLFNRMCEKGHEPNRWTYEIIVQGLHKYGRTDEARCWVEQMFRKGFNPTERTRSFM